MMVNMAPFFLEHLSYNAMRYAVEEPVVPSASWKSPELKHCTRTLYGVPHFGCNLPIYSLSSSFQQYGT